MRRHILALAVTTVIWAALPGQIAARPRPASTDVARIVYFGTHGNAIFAARLDPLSGRLEPLGIAAQIDRPTWQVADPVRPILYSVSETGNDGKSQATVSSLSIDRATGKLTVLNQVNSGGGGATHLSLDTRSHTLFVANFGTGSVASIPVNADGTLGPVVSFQQDVGTGPKPRQTSPHAHAVAIDPSGKFLLVPDLGADRVFVYAFDPGTRTLQPAAKPFAASAPGAGPRHIVFAPSGRIAYIDDELSGDVTAYGWSAAQGRLHALQTVSAFPADYSGERSAAELTLSHDGRFLYVSTRNNDTIVAYAVDPATGMLSEIQRLPAGGKTPWSFSLSPEGHWLLVANEASSLITVFKVDHQTGKLAGTDQTLAIPKPVSVTFAPR